jgi:K+/H+ antiporter YhaU regulatory subunit KhtT
MTGLMIANLLRPEFFKIAISLLDIIRLKEIKTEINKEAGIIIVKSQGVIRTKRERKSHKPTPFSVIKTKKEEDLVSKITDTKIMVIKRNCLILFFNI